MKLTTGFVDVAQALSNLPPTPMGDMEPSDFVAIEEARKMLLGRNGKPIARQTVFSLGVRHQLDVRMIAGRFFVTCASIEAYCARDVPEVEPRQSRNEQLGRPKGSRIGHDIPRDRTTTCWDSQHGHTPMPVYHYEKNLPGDRGLLNGERFRAIREAM